MSEDDQIHREVGEFFDRYFRFDHKIDDVKALDAVLPNDPKVLRGLGARCLDEAQKAIRAGHHAQGRRLDILGRQLQKRAQNAKP
jgi:hypothetical protein